MQNTLYDLNNHLFAQLERLNDEGIEGDELKEEINRAKAVSGIADTVIKNGQLVLDAKKFTDDHLDADNQLPKMLEGESDA